MKTRRIGSEAASDIRIIVLDSGEEAFSTLQSFARENGISAA